MPRPRPNRAPRFRLTARTAGTARPYRDTADPPPLPSVGHPLDLPGGDNPVAVLTHIWLTRLGTRPVTLRALLAGDDLTNPDDDLPHLWAQLAAGVRPDRLVRVEPLRHPGVRRLVLSFLDSRANPIPAGCPHPPGRPFLPPISLPIHKSLARAAIFAHYDRPRPPNDFAGYALSLDPPPRLSIDVFPDDDFDRRWGPAPPPVPPPDPAPLPRRGAVPVDRFLAACRAAGPLTRETLP